MLTTISPRGVQSHLNTYKLSSIVNDFIGEVLVKRRAGIFALICLLGLAKNLFGADEPRIASLVKQLDAADASVRRRAAITLGGMGELAQAAVPALTEMLQSDKAALNRSAAAFALGGIDTPEAKKALSDVLSRWQKAVEVDPTDEAVRYNLGIVYQQMGELDKAIPEFKAAIRIKADFSAAYNNLGKAYGIQGDFEEAIAAFRTSVRIDPNSPVLHTNLGIVYQQQGKFDSAVSAYKKAIEIDPNYAETYTNLGIVYRKQGRFEEAVEAYKTAIRLNPNYAEAHNNLGYVYEDLNRWDEAIAAYKEAIHINPNLAETYANLGFIYERQGHNVEAIDQYRSFIRLASENAALKDLIAEAQRRIQIIEAKSKLFD